MKKRTKGIHQSNISTLAQSFGGPVAKILDHLSPITITFFRSIFAIPALWIYLVVTKQNFRLPRKIDYGWMVLLGLLSTATTVTAFHAIQQSSVAVGMLAIYTSPIILVFLEPLFFRSSIKWYDFFSASVAFFGLYVVVPEFSLNSGIARGILWGLLTAFFIAFLLIITRKKAVTISGPLMTFYSNIIAILLLFPSLFFVNFSLNYIDMGYLILLGVIATALGHGLGAHALKYISATSAGIIASLEPIYATILAIFMVGEIPELRTIIGGTIILSVVIFESLKHKWISDDSLV